MVASALVARAVVTRAVVTRAVVARAYATIAHGSHLLSGLVFTQVGSVVLGFPILQEITEKHHEQDEKRLKESKFCACLPGTLASEVEGQFTVVSWKKPFQFF